VDGGGRVSGDGRGHGDGGTAPVRRICGATVTLPLSVLAQVLVVVPGERAHPIHVVTGLRCALESHATGRHYDLVRQLDDASMGEVWVSWEAGAEPDRIGILPDCPALSTVPGAVDTGRPGGASADDSEACVLFAGHPGGHSFDFRDPEYEAVLASPEYGRLKEEWEARLAPPGSGNGAAPGRPGGGSPGGSEEGPGKGAGAAR
jgi:hypothetical protein